MQFEQLGPYKIGRRVGRGGMGAVFEGVNVETGERAAIKVLNPHLSDDAGFRERFEIEIETLKKLRHPNIVRMYGYGEQDGHLYYAMELVDGQSVEEAIQAGKKFSWQDVVRHGIALCKALRHAHDHGVIHRDIKPANLLITGDGEVKLTDFGIARLFGNTSMTMEGGLVGTAEFMSPEQASGERVTPQSDLYSLGGVMFTMLAGRPPFRTKSLGEMLHKQRFEPPPPVSRFASDTPLELQEFIGMLLSKDPKARGANALVLSRQLAAMQHGLSMVRNQPAKAEAPPPAPLHIDTLNDRATANDDSKTRLASSQLSSPPVDPNSPTMDAPAASQHSPTVPKQPRPLAEPAHSALGSRTRRTGGADDSRDHESDQDLAVEPPAPSTLAENRFVTVEEDERQRAEREQQQSRVPAIVQTISLALSLVVIVGLLWYFARPPSADALYHRIDVAANQSDPGELLRAEQDITDFLARFPDDPRAETVRRYERDVEAQRMENRFQLRVRLVDGAEDLSPAECDYVEAIALEATDPWRALQKLSAIVQLYQDDDGADANAQVVELAKRKRDELQASLERSTTNRLAVIDQQLERAAELRSTDPTKASALWRSIIELYGDKPWAESQVKQAQTALEAAMP